MMENLLFRRSRNWIAEAVTAAGAIGSAAINASMQARTNAQNREQAQYAFNQQQQAIQRMNEFNSPGQQVLRMKSAGLNPSLAYGADGAMVGQQSEAPAYNPIPAESPSVGNVGSGIADAIRTGIEVRDLERRQDLANAEIAAQDWRNFVAMTEGNLNLATAEETLRLLGFKEQEYESKIELNWETLLKTREEVANLKQERKEILSRIKLNEEQVKELAARAHLSETQAYAILQRLPHEIAEMDAQAAFAWAQESVGREEVRKIARDIQHIGFVEWANARDFDFEKNSKVADLEFQRYGYKVDIAKSLMNTISVLTGASAMRRGEPMPPVTSSHPAPLSGGSYGSGRRRR